jgi:hypothetical protein
MRPGNINTIKRRPGSTPRVRKLPEKQMRKLYEKTRDAMDKKLEDDKKQRLDYEQKHCTCCPIHGNYHRFKVSGW